jgi:c-di-GMP-binding flagellar brake protein YcgR
LKTKDISGGGLRLISKTPLAERSVMGLTFEISGYGEIMIDARVVRSQKLESDSSLYWIAFEFVDISTKERNAIIQFIFKKQLEERRKFFKK